MVWKVLPALLALGIGLLTLCGAEPVPVERLLTPGDAVTLAAADAAKLPEDAARRMLYLWRGNAPAKEWAALTAVLAGHVNQLSSDADLSPPRGVGSDLLAVDIGDYGWKRAIVDQFEETDYQFYVFTEQVVTIKETVELGYEDEKTGKWIKTRDVVRDKQVKKKQAALAPWLPKEATVKLALLTGARAPIVSAATFLRNTGGAGDGRKPDYYSLQNIASETDWLKLVGAEIEKDVAFTPDLLGAIGISGVTQEPRAIQRVDKRGGSVWSSFDVNKGESKGEKNAKRFLGSDAKGKPKMVYDATEKYGHAANGTWRFLLADAAGKIQATAPDKVAGSGRAILRNDHRVMVCASCIECHDKGGLQDLGDEWVRKTFTPPPLDLLAGNADGKPLDYAEVKRLRSQYRRKLDPFIEADRKRYEAALKDACGLSSKEFSEAFTTAWKEAADPTIDLAWAARSLGCTPATLVKALDRQIKTKGKVDPVLAEFLLPNEKQEPLTITLGQWSEAYPVAQAYLSEAGK